MACNTVEVLRKLENGMFASIGWADISCRHETDWYVSLGGKNFIADHLPTREAAVKALQEYLNKERYGT